METKIKSTGIELFQSKPQSIRAIQYLNIEDVQKLNIMLDGQAKFFDDMSIRINKVKIERSQVVLFAIDGTFKGVMNHEKFISEFEKVDGGNGEPIDPETKSPQNTKKGGK